ncbi:Tyrosine-protein kinase Dnt [Hypsibius exemplaris]|uniref:Tyrosine-protein kinase Dnt n=1 Tax=Hypsibius exemplaris TaxID=2072580 RepID=A0A9X6RLL1_HYPEX|nr:Tyrosine-protein kinase Dnt [Hypsibius exemplaris]
MRRLFFFVLLHTLFLAAYSAKLDLYISAAEQNRISGAPGELWYIKDGVLNDYAVRTYTITVASSISVLRFMWQKKDPIVEGRYFLEVKHDPNDAFGEWSSSLNKGGGLIPEKLEEFNLTLPCTGKANAEIDLTILLTIMTGGRDYKLPLKRKKICSQRSSDVVVEVTPLPAGPSKEDQLLGQIDARNVAVPWNTQLWAIFGSVFVALVIVAFAAYFILRKNRRKGSHAEHGAMGMVPLNGTLTGHRSPVALTETELIYQRQGIESPRQSLLSGSRTAYEYGMPQHGPGDVAASSVVPDQAVTMEDMQIDGSSVEILETIAEGTFSAVQRGIWVAYDPDRGCNVPEDVRIKTVKSVASDAQIHIMLSDACLLLGLRHDNVNCLLGTFFGSADEPDLLPMLVYNGAHHSNLRTLLDSSNRKHFLPLTDLILLGLQSLSGLECLHQHGIVHKDIAARNCLVSHDLNLQITDSSLSRDLFPDDYHCSADNSNRPIKWMALELLSDNEFTRMSDVWSWGVLMWEIMSFGSVPFVEIDPGDVKQLLKEGFRLESPPDCPEELYMNHISPCWQLEPLARPTVEALIYGISHFHASIAHTV